VRRWGLGVVHRSRAISGPSHFPQRAALRQLLLFGSGVDAVSREPLNPAARNPKAPVAVAGERWGRTATEATLFRSSSGMSVSRPYSALQRPSPPR
jgi:hypothetical protein